MRTSTYLDRVSRNLQGISAVSAGTCPGCETCRGASSNYTPRETWRHVDGEDVYVYVFRARPEESFATEESAEEAARAAFDEDVRDGRVVDEGGFSSSECDLCESSLGGDRYPWHYCATPDPRGAPIEHGEGVCVDCLAYLANGELPPDEED